MIAQPRDLSAADSETALDLIFVEGFTGETIIGIDSSELHVPQPLVIDVHAGLPHVPACVSDSIGDTIHYGVVCERLRRLLASHQHQLLESFAEEIARILLVEFRAAWVRVKVVKPRKFDDVQAVGVQLERRASVQAAETATASQRGAGVLRLIGSGMVPGKR